MWAEFLLKNIFHVDIEMIYKIWDNIIKLVEKRFKIWILKI